MTGNKGNLLLEIKDINYWKYRTSITGNKGHLSLEIKDIYDWK